MNGLSISAYSLCYIYKGEIDLYVYKRLLKSKCRPLSIRKICLQKWFYT